MYRERLKIFNPNLTNQQQQGICWMELVFNWFAVFPQNKNESEIK